MDSVKRSLLIIVMTYLSVDSQCSAQTCPRTVSFGNGTNLYRNCLQLSSLQSTLLWTFEAKSGTVDLAFRALPESSACWVGWGINPTRLGMVGTQTLMAFRHSNGQIYVNTYDYQSKNPTGPGPITIRTRNLSAIYNSSSGHFTIFAVLSLPNNKTNVNHVWNVGSSVIGKVPQQHSLDGAHTRSLGIIDFATGLQETSSNPGQILKNSHGIVNAVGWGIMMPVGVMIARYLRTFESADPAWYYMHALCQTSAFALGVAGWATGLCIPGGGGEDADTHGAIAHSLFVLGALQVSALLLRPGKDHRLRPYWNAYHRSEGYAVITLAIFNVFKGFQLLQPAIFWKMAFIIVIAFLGVIAVISEILTWIISFKRKCRASHKSSSFEVAMTFFR